MKWLILFISFSVSADICRVDYAHEFKTIYGYDISSENLDFELWINGELYKTNTAGTSTRFMWWADVCQCDTWELRAVNTRLNINSVFVLACSPPAQPVICQ